MVPRSWYILVLTTRSFQQTKHDKPYESLKSISLYLFFLNQNHPTGSQKEHLASPPIPCLHLFSVKELLLASNFVLKRFVFYFWPFEAVEVVEKILPKMVAKKKKRIGAARKIPFSTHNLCVFTSLIFFHSLKKKRWRERELNGNYD